MLNTASGIRGPLDSQAKHKSLASDHRILTLLRNFSRSLPEKSPKRWYGPWIPGLHIRLEVRILPFYLNESKKLLKS